MKKILLAVIFVVCMGLTWGGPLKKEFIGSDSKWVIHADYEAFSKTKMSSVIREEMKARGIEKQLNDLKSTISFHVLDDIQNITVCGIDKDDSTVVVMVQGNFEISKLVSMVDTKPSYKKVVYKTFEVSSWEENVDGGKETTYASSFGSNVILLSKNKDRLVNGLDSLSLGDNAFAEKYLLKKPEKGTFLSAYGKNINGKFKDDKNDETFFMNVGETDGNLFVIGNITAKTKDEATTVFEAFQGGVAMAKLAIPEEMKRLKEVVNTIKVTLKNRSVSLEFRWDSCDLVDILKESDQIKKQLENK